jgi:hypothetical protein
MKPNGFLLLQTLLVISILLLLGASLAGLAASNLKLNQANLNQIKAFYLAESGIAFAEAKLISQEAWFTDAVHYPSDDLIWLEKSAQGTLEACGEGYFKVIKEEGKSRIYSIGVVGDFKNPRAKCFIKLNQTYSFL